VTARLLAFAPMVDTELARLVLSDLAVAAALVPLPMPPHLTAPAPAPAPGPGPDADIGRQATRHAFWG